MEVNEIIYLSLMILAITTAIALYIGYAQGKIKYILSITWKVTALGAFLTPFAWTLYALWTTDWITAQITPYSYVNDEVLSILMVACPIVTLVGAAISAIIGVLVALVISNSKLRA